MTTLFKTSAWSLRNRVAGALMLFAVVVLTSCSSESSKPSTRYAEFTTKGWCLNDRFEGSDLKEYQVAGLGYTYEWLFEYSQPRKDAVSRGFNLSGSLDSLQKIGAGLRKGGFIQVKGTKPGVLAFAADEAKSQPAIVWIEKAGIRPSIELLSYDIDVKTLLDFANNSVSPINEISALSSPDC